MRGSDCCRVCEDKELAGDPKKRQTMIPMNYTMADAEALGLEMAYRLDSAWGRHVVKLAERFEDIAAGQRFVMATTWRRDWRGVRTKWTSKAASCLNGLRCSIKWPEAEATMPALKGPLLHKSEGDSK